MKSICVFSGKGGAGKSSIAALLALALSKKHNVALVDLDINTPSIPVMFGGRTEVGSLTLHSTGYRSKGISTYMGRMVRTMLKDVVKDAVATNPDVVVMDMPPGTGDIHLQVITKLTPGAAVLVLQPNNLCKEDALRSIALFMQHKVPVVGVIENMVGDIFGDHIELVGLPVLKSIPLRKDVANAGNEGRIDEVSNPVYSVAEKIFRDAAKADWDVEKKRVYEEADPDDLIAGGFMDNIKKRSDLKYLGVNSWDAVRERLLSMDLSKVIPNMNPDRFLMENDGKTIKRMLDNLDEDDSGLFMMVRPPSTEIKLFPGEVTIAHLRKLDNDAYYRVPRLSWPTDEGEVVIFASEASPISPKKLHDLIDRGELVLASNSKTQRYVPSPEQLEGIAEVYGRMTTVPKNWKEEYAKLGIEVEQAKLADISPGVKQGAE